MLHHLTVLDADVFCLQEVETYRYWNEELQKYGYQGIYKSRENGKPDGCAIFYKEKKYFISCIKTRK